MYSMPIFQLVRHVLLFSPTCSFISVKQDLLKKNESTRARYINSTLHHFLAYTLKLTVRAGKKQKLTKEMFSNCSVRTFYLYLALFRCHMHVE